MFCYIEHLTSNVDAFLIFWDLTFPKMNPFYLEKGNEITRGERLREWEKLREREKELFIIGHRMNACLSSFVSASTWVQFLEYFGSIKMIERNCWHIQPSYPYGSFKYNSLKWLMSIFWEIWYYSFVLSCLNVILFFNFIWMNAEISRLLW